MGRFDHHLVTVVIPAFNAAATLRATLNSAAAQSHRALEILIVDDGSRDATGAIAQAFCEQEPRARQIRQDNRGVVAARNRGLNEACGEFIAPLDADDLWHPDKIARQLAAALAGPMPGFVYCWSRDIDGEDQVWRDGPAVTHEGAVFLRMLAHNFVGNGSALLVRRDAALAVGGYRKELRSLGAEGVEDIVFQLDLAARYRAAVAPAYLVGYRWHAASASYDHQAMLDAWLAARELVDRSGLTASRADRRNLARRRLLVSEALVRQRRLSDAARLGLAAFAGDPLRSGLAVSALIAHRIGKQGSANLVRPMFGDLPPEQAAFLPSAGIAARLLGRLDTRRSERLAAEERLSST